MLYSTFVQRVEESKKFPELSLRLNNAKTWEEFDQLNLPASYAYLFTYQIFNHPVHELENLAAKESIIAVLYARYILKGRFYKGEEKIEENEYLNEKYWMFVDTLGEENEF